MLPDGALLGEGRSWRPAMSRSSVQAHLPGKAADSHAGYRSIQEAAALLGVTQRTLRFYEDNGLVTPQRAGGTRIYSRRDIARMQLILRGKRLGFTIREIGEFLALYDSDPDQREQTELLLARVRARLAGLAAQRAAIEETIRELRDIEREACDKLRDRG